MTREEINRYIHVEIRKECWHELGFKVFDPADKSRTGRVCPHCRSFFRDEQRPNNPDYCSGASARSLLEEVVAIVTGYFRGPNVHGWKGGDVEEVFAACLRKVLGIDGPKNDLMMLANATAEQIARACVEAHKMGARSL